MSAASGSAVGLAAPGSASPALARYFTTLNPILATARNASITWTRVLDETARRRDSTAHAEAQQAALGQGQALEETRRALAAVPPPPELEAMHRSADRWLKATRDSCEVIYRSRSPIGSKS